MGVMGDTEPFVTLIIPCRNEAAFIQGCLDSVVRNDYPQQLMEIFVLDGMSQDGTRELIQSFIKQYKNMTLLDNAALTIPSAMNIGIRKAQGSVIMKIDGHAVYPSDYIRKCVDGLRQYDAENVGGVITAVPRDNTILGRSIVLSLSNIFGIGNSTFRLGCSHPVLAKTTYSGCYKRDVFDRVGLYDENILRSEDVVLNAKLLKVGGRIIVDPGIVVVYYARSRFGAFVRHNFDNGFWVTYPLRFGVVFVSLRHLIPMVFVTGLMALAAFAAMAPGFWAAVSVQMLMLTVAVYLMSCLLFAIQVARTQKDLRFLFTMPLIFGALHLSYGFGSCWGLLNVALSFFRRK